MLSNIKLSPSLIIINFSSETEHALTVKIIHLYLSYVPPSFTPYKTLYYGFNYENAFTATNGNPIFNDNAISIFHKNIHFEANF